MKETKVLSVPDISCKHCVMAITNGLKGIDGIFKTDVDLEKKAVTVEYDSEKTRLETIKTAIEEQGYTVK